MKIKTIYKFLEFLEDEHSVDPFPNYAMCDKCLCLKLRINAYWYPKMLDWIGLFYTTKYVCKECTNKYSRVSSKGRRKRIPKWSELEQIEIFYKNCPKGYQVDHVIPLQGKAVSGLHVLNNLQYLTKEDNLKKNNKFTIDKSLIASIPGNI